MVGERKVERDVVDVKESREIQLEKEKQRDMIGERQSREIWLEKEQQRDMVGEKELIEGDMVRLGESREIVVSVEFTIWSVQRW